MPAWLRHTDREVHPWGGAGDTLAPGPAAAATPSSVPSTKNRWGVSQAPQYSPESGPKGMLPRSENLRNVSRLRGAVDAPCQSISATLAFLVKGFVAGMPAWALTCATFVWI